MMHLLHNDISVFTHDFKHITKNCQTQSSLSRVENHGEEIKNYYDGNEISDWCGSTSCTQCITTITFEADLENPVKPCSNQHFQANLIHEQWPSAGAPWEQF